MIQSVFQTPAHTYFQRCHHKRIYQAREEYSMQLWKWSGTLLILTGIGHSIVGMIKGWDVLVLIAQDGFINAIGLDPSRLAFLFFMLSGFIVIFLGHLCHWIINTRKAPLPHFMGWYFFWCGLLGMFLLPVSGFFLLIPQGLIILFPQNVPIGPTET